MLLLSALRAVRGARVERRDIARERAGPAGPAHGWLWPVQLLECADVVIDLLHGLTHGPQLDCHHLGVGFLHGGRRVVRIHLTAED